MGETAASLRGVKYTLSQILRVGHYLSQARVGFYLFKKKPSEEAVRLAASPKIVIEDLWALFQRDYQNIQSGIYKEPRGWGENWPAFWLKSLKTFKDLFSVKKREEKRAVKDIPKGVGEKDFPNYFLQTFHYQTDGYLSDHSAELYDHQVELVFVGGAEAMRRQSLVPVYHYLVENSHLKNPKLLDVACGTGLFLKEIKDNYSKVNVTGLDLSPWYLKKARENLASYAGVDFVEANAENIPFKDNHFDIVTSVFLFHELPEKVRALVAAEMSRVLKPGGLLIFQDALQLGDKPKFDGSLKAFPESYYEPYFLNYIQGNVAEDFFQKSLKLERVDDAFFSKILVLRKSHEA